MPGRPFFGRECIVWVMISLGVHTGLQHTTMGELRSFWRRVDELGFSWVSIWDHFYAATGDEDAHCLEAVVAHAALACSTSRVRCGSLVYCADRKSTRLNSSHRCISYA